MEIQSRKRFLVRKLIIIDRTMGKEIVLPLMIVSGVVKNDMLEDTEILKYESEIESTAYVSEMQLIYEGSKNNYIISKIF